MADMYKDIIAFHEKFGLKQIGKPDLGSKHYQEFRVNFLKEELAELEAGLEKADYAEVFDALIDLVYVAMGTAYGMGFPWQEGWDEVQRANMSKVRANNADDSKRGTLLDVVKPDDWKSPDIEGIVMEAFMAEERDYR